VYPHHGAGTVVSKDVKVVLGEEREYLTIKILHNEMTVNVPVENAEKVGLRWVIDEEMVEVVVKALTGGGTQMPKNWNRRFKHNRDKMKTGDIFELAEVVRNLSLRDHEKGLSTGEKQMFVKAKKILASELMYAKDMDEDEAARVARRRPPLEPERGLERAEEDDYFGEAREGGVEERLRSPPRASRRQASPRRSPPRRASRRRRRAPRRGERLGRPRCGR